MNKTNENGRSMIEMLGVLAIIGVLSVGGIAGYSKAMSKYRTNKVIEQVTMLITNIRTMYAQQQNYDGLYNSRAVNLELVPEEMIVDSGKDKEDTASDRRLRNIFSGDVGIWPSAVESGDCTGSTHCGAFKVTFYGLSRDACLQIATSDWGAGISSGLIGMHIWVPTAAATQSSNDSRGSMQLASDSMQTMKTETPSQGSDTGTSTGGNPSTAANDPDMDTIYKSGSKGTANIAIPGDPTYRIPFTVNQAQTACACRGKNTCAVTWKYF